MTPLELEHEQRIVDAVYGAFNRERLRRFRDQIGYGKNHDNEMLKLRDDVFNRLGKALEVEVWPESTCNKYAPAPKVTKKAKKK